MERSPDQAALSTVLSFLRNKKLKDTEDALRKELSLIGSDYNDLPTHPAIEVSSLSGTEPAKYEESYSGSTGSITSSTRTRTDFQSATSEDCLSLTTQSQDDDDHDMEPLNSNIPTLETSSNCPPLPNLIEKSSFRPNALTFTKTAPTLSSPTQTVINIGSPLQSPIAESPDPIDANQTLIAYNSDSQQIIPSAQFTMGGPLLYQVGTSRSNLGRQILTPILTMLPNSGLLNPVTAATLQAGGQPIMLSSTSVSSQPIQTQSHPRTSSETSINSMPSPGEHRSAGSPRTLASLMLSEMTPQYMELKAFAEEFKTRRIRLGFTQGAVGLSLARMGYNNFAQSTISRFEQMQLSPANAAAIKQVLEKWLQDAECPEAQSVSSSTSVVPLMNCRKRKKRAVFTAHTRNNLDDYFRQNPRPNRQLIDTIADELNLLPEEVRVWFCNKRQKKKQSSDRESSVSTSSYIDSPPSLFEPNKLRSPSPPKTPFTIEELSKSSAGTSTINSVLATSPMQLSTLGLVRPLSASGLYPMVFNVGRRSPPSLIPHTAVQTTA